MRILMLNYEYPPLGGGAGNETKYFLREFAKYPDLEIDLVTSSVDDFRIERHSERIRIHFLDIGKKGNIHYQSIGDLLKYSFRGLRYCRKLMKENKYDITHAFFGIPSGYMGMKLGIPYVNSLQGSDVPFYSKRFYLLDTLLFRRLSKKVWKRSSATIANSIGLRELALKAIPDADVGVIPNGVDTGEFVPDFNKTKNDKIHLISTGRLIERKGYHFLMEAMQGMEDDFKLILIGDGNMQGQLQQQAKELHLDVEFRGVIDHDDLPGMLNQADVFVLPTQNEGMSNSILEAIAAGLPIFMTKVGGSDECVNGNGWAVEPGKVDPLRAVLEELRSGMADLDKMARRSKEIADSMSWEAVAKRYKDLFEECLR